MSLPQFLLTGCQKEEHSIPPSSSQESVNINSGSKETSEKALVFRAITFDHLNGKSFLPDYIVTVTNEGIVTYVGRANVRTLGTVEYKVHPQILY